MHSLCFISNLLSRVVGRNIALNMQYKLNAVSSPPRRYVEAQVTVNAAVPGTIPFLLQASCTIPQCKFLLYCCGKTYLCRYMAGHRSILCSPFRLLPCGLHSLTHHRSQPKILFCFGILYRPQSELTSKFWLLALCADGGRDSYHADNVIFERERSLPILSN